MGSGWHSRGSHSIIPVIPHLQRKKRMKINSFFVNTSCTILGLMYEPALKTWSRRGRDYLATFIILPLNLASRTGRHIDGGDKSSSSRTSSGSHTIQNLVVVVGRWENGGLRGHVPIPNRALIPRTTESRDWFLITARNWRWTALLETNDVPAEAEAEVARIIAWNLLCRHVHPTVEETWKQ